MSFSETLPKISVLISTYDDRRFIGKKLREIEAQTVFDAAEFLFIEPASPGREREVLSGFCAERSNCRLLALDERVNLPAAWNIGWHAGRAPYACISNMDDCMHPRLLELLLKTLDQKQWDIASVLIATQLMDASGHSWERARVAKLNLAKRPGPFFAWRRDLKDRGFGMFDEQLTVAADKDFWARAGAERLVMQFLPKVLYFYTQHPDQLSKNAAFGQVKAQDKKHLSKKPYPIAWPRRYRRLVRVAQLARRISGVLQVDAPADAVPPPSQG